MVEVAVLQVYLPCHNVYRGRLAVCGPAVAPEADAGYLGEVYVALACEGRQVYGLGARRIVSAAHLPPCARSVDVCVVHANAHAGFAADVGEGEAERLVVGQFTVGKGEHWHQVVCVGRPCVGRRLVGGTACRCAEGGVKFPGVGRCRANGQQESCHGNGKSCFHKLCCLVKHVFSDVWAHCRLLRCHTRSNGFRAPRLVCSSFPGCCPCCLGVKAFMPGHCGARHVLLPAILFHVIGSMSFVTRRKDSKMSGKGVCLPFHRFLFLFHHDKCVGARRLRHRSLPA